MSTSHIVHENGPFLLYFIIGLVEVVVGIAFRCEDDDMYSRIEQAGYKLIRPKPEKGTFFLREHKSEGTSESWHRWNYGRYQLSLSLSLLQLRHEFVLEIPVFKQNCLTLKAFCLTR